MKKLLTVILFCILTLGMASVASAADWQWMYDNGEGKSFFDAQSFQKTGPNTYSVACKTQYFDDVGKELSSLFEFKAPISYFLFKMEVNYTTEKYKMLSATFYDKNDNLLNLQDHAGNEWLDVRNDDTIIKTFNTTYAYYKKKYK